MTLPLDQQYRDLSRVVRQVQVEELKSGNYNHIKNPNSKGKQKFRVNYMFRPGMELGNNRQNLSASSNEIILEYHGIPCQDGFIIRKDRPLRVIAGERATPHVVKELKTYQVNPLVQNFLEKGDYKNFVRVTLQEAEYQLSQL